MKTINLLRHFVKWKCSNFVTIRLNILDVQVLVINVSQVWGLADRPVSVSALYQSNFYLFRGNVYLLVSSLFLFPLVTIWVVHLPERPKWA